MLGRPGFQSWLHQASFLSKFSFSHSSNRLNQSVFEPQRGCVCVARGPPFPLASMQLPFHPSFIKVPVKKFSPTERLE